MIEAARAEATKPREVELFPLKAVTPANIGYETARRACVSGALRATKIAGDWFVSQTDMASWLTSSGHWFESESAVERWRADIARLKRWWIA